tara:strand:+ start:232 stop:390 length:159 start_codon:yes stop_codon:yes gene_type:complete
MILDNRNQKQGLEIGEDGYGKWYVVTDQGSCLAVRTKTEALAVMANLDYYEL